MAGWSQNRRGEWHLEADVPSAEDAVHVRVLHDDGGCYGVMMEMPFGAHLVAVIGGWPYGRSGIVIGELTDPPWRPCPDLSLVARVRPGGPLSCLTARCASVANPAWHRRASVIPAH